MDDILQLWPLVLAIEDCYIPKLAPVVVETISELDEVSRSLMFGYMAELARMMLVLERN